MRTTRDLVANPAWQMLAIDSKMMQRQRCQQKSAASEALHEAGWMALHTMPSHRGAMTHICLPPANFYTPHKRFDTQKAFTRKGFFTQTTFTHRSFYTQTFYTQKALAHTHRFLHTEKLWTLKRLHTESLYTVNFIHRKVLHTEALSHICFDTNVHTHTCSKCVDTSAKHRSFHTHRQLHTQEEHLHMKTFTKGRLLHTENSRGALGKSHQVEQTNLSRLLAQWEFWTFIAHCIVRGVITARTK